MNKVNEVIENIKNDFQMKMLEKKKSFNDRIHSAFILNTSITIWGKKDECITKEQYGWLSFTYPKTEIYTGNDQGASYTTITPKF